MFGSICLSVYLLSQEYPCNSTDSLTWCVPALATISMPTFYGWSCRLISSIVHPTTLWYWGANHQIFLLSLSHAKQLYSSPTTSTSWIPSCLLMSCNQCISSTHSLFPSMYHVTTCLRFHSAYVGNPSDINSFPSLANYSLFHRPNSITLLQLLLPYEYQAVS